MIGWSWGGHFCWIWCQEAGWWWSGGIRGHSYKGAQSASEVPLALGSTSAALVQSLTCVAWDRTPQILYSNLKHIDSVQLLANLLMSEPRSLHLVWVCWLCLMDFLPVCAQSCPTVCGPMDCTQRGSSLHGIFQARILEWVAISYSRGFSWLRDRTLVSCISELVRRFFTTSATWEAFFSSTCTSPVMHCLKYPVWFL